MTGCEVIKPKEASGCTVTLRNTDFTIIKADLAARLADASSPEEMRKTVNEFCKTIGLIRRHDLKELSRMIALRKDQLELGMVKSLYKRTDYVFLTISRWLHSSDVYLSNKDNQRCYGEAIYDLAKLKERLINKSVDKHIHVHDTIRVVDAWLNSKDVRVSDDTLVIKCQPFSLLNRLMAI